MSMLRKIFISGVMMVTVLSMSIVVAPQAKAAASAGDLIKVSGLSSVYYLGANGKRYVFPNESTYFSWYKDFSGVITIPASEMAGYPLAANVVIRPGTKLVKSPSDPKVYAVEPNGTLRSIVSEANAIALWGANWAKMVVDMPDSFFVNYTVGSPLAVGQYPIGQLIKTAGSPDVMVLAADGTVRKFASQAAFDANNYNFNYVATVPSTYVMPTTGAVINGMESSLDNVAQSGSVPGPVAGGSGLSVALASDTAASANVAINTPTPMLSFNLTASNDGAATVNSITLTAGGLSVASEITNIILYANGTRIGNVKSALDSNRQAIFNLATPLAIAAGQTVEVTAKAIVTNTNNYSLTVAKASDINAGGATVSGSFPISGNTISGANVTVGKLTINNNGTPSDVNLGDINAIIGKFKIQADGTEDITLNSITLQRSNGTSVNTDFANVALYYNGSSIATAPAGFTGKSNGYANFVLTTPLVIKKSQTALFEVHADIIDGRAGDTITVALDSSADVNAVGNTYGQAVQIAAGSTEFSSSYSTTFKIKAGTIALAKQEAANDKTKSNTTNVVFGTLKLTSNSAQGATFDTLKTTITSTADTPSGAAFAQLQNVKLVDEETGQSFDLDYAQSTSGSVKIYGAANDIGLTLVSGKTYSLDLEGDISSAATSSSYQFSIASVSGGDLIIHDVNNTVITDVTPNSLSFNAVTVQKPAVTFSINPLSKSLPTVVGSTNVTALDFNVQANQTSNLKIQELDFLATTSNTYVTKSQVAAYYLYKTGVSTPIKSVSGSSISALGVVTFNGLSETVSANVTNEYYVTVDLTQDSNQAGANVQVALEGYNIIDSDSNNVYDSTNDSGHADTLSMPSARKIALVSAGSLWLAVDNTNTNTQKSQLVVAGNTVPYLAAFKMRATNENVKITNLSVDVSNSNAASMFSSLEIDDSTGAPLATVNNVTASTTFANINLIVPMSTQTYYLKGTLRPIGQNQVGVSQASTTFNIYGITAKGVASNLSLTGATTTAQTCASLSTCYVSSGNSHRVSTLNSNYTETVASRISSVDLVSSGGGCSLASSLTAGLNTVAVIKITTDNTGANTLLSGDVVKTILDKVQVDFTKTNVGTPTFTIQKCSGLDTTPTDGTVSVNGSASSTSFALGTGVLPNDALIPSQTTVYFKVVANIPSVSSTAGNSSMEVDLNHLDGTQWANFTWKDSSDVSGDVTALLLSNSSIQGTKLTN
ncbi:MAG TPA: hypothetical protein VMC41_01090 [Candidatus Nanoarchaeia archaeon]|nr:hypothetical protein [Candidatus Nanoarchaeia archaeon]